MAQTSHAVFPNIFVQQKVEEAQREKDELVRKIALLQQEKEELESEKESLQKECEQQKEMCVQLRRENQVSHKNFPPNEGQLQESCSFGISWGRKINKMPLVPSFFM